MTSGCRGEREGAMPQFISNWVVYHVYMYFTTDLQTVIYTKQFTARADLFLK